MEPSTTSALSEETQRRVSPNDIDYAKFVLYVRRGVTACDVLVRMASRCNDVIVQDVDKISGPRPEWLRGVPSLVLLPGFDLLTGTRAMQAMEAHLRTGVQGFPAGLLGGQVGCAGAPLEEDEMGGGGPAAGAAMRFGLAVSPDERYEDAPRERTMAGVASLEDMMRQRAARGSSAQLQ